MRTFNIQRSTFNVEGRETSRTDVADILPDGPKAGPRRARRTPQPARGRFHQVWWRSALFSGGTGLWPVGFGVSPKPSRARDRSMFDTIQLRRSALNVECSMFLFLSVFFASLRLCGSNCFAQVPFAFWQTPSAQSTNAVPGFQYHWTGDAGLSISAGQVNSWTDSAAGLVLTNIGTGPGTSTQNGHTVLQFSDSGLGNALQNTGQTLSSDWEFVAVAKTGADIANGNPFCIEGDSGTARGVFISEDSWEVSWNLTAFGGTPAASTWYVVDAVFLATGTTTLSINGTAVATQSGLIYTQTGIEIGGFGIEYPWSGAIAEVLIYTTPLNSAQQAQNVSNLRAKYGI